MSLCEVCGLGLGRHKVTPGGDVFCHRRVKRPYILSPVTGQTVIGEFDDFSTRAMGFEVHEVDVAIESRKVQRLRLRDKPDVLDTPEMFPDV